MIDYDLENSPLEIQTDSVVGSDEQVTVWFYTAQGDDVGRVHLNFTSPLQYWITWCRPSWTNFPTELPSDNNKIWTITLTRTSGIRLVIHCNNKEVLNVVISGTTCSNSAWSTYWSRDKEKIQFSSSDTASDYYRAGGSNNLYLIYLETQW